MRFRSVGPVVREVLCSRPFWVSFGLELGLELHPLGNEHRQRCNMGTPEISEALVLRGLPSEILSPFARRRFCLFRIALLGHAVEGRANFVELGSLPVNQTTIDVPESLWQHLAEKIECLSRTDRTRNN